MPALTFATISGDLSEGVIAAVTLASDHAGFALALAAVPVTRSGQGAERVTVTQQTAVAALGTVVVVLGANAEEELTDRSPNQPLYYITAVRVITGTIWNVLSYCKTLILFPMIKRFERHIKGRFK